MSVQQTAIDTTQCVHIDEKLKHLPCPAAGMTLLTTRAMTIITSTATVLWTEVSGTSGAMCSRQETRSRLYSRRLFLQFSGNFSNYFWPRGIA